MSQAAAETILAAIIGLAGQKGEWPPKCERPILEHINTWIAMREGDKDALKKVADWRGPREYRVDGLPERIADAWAHFLVGEDPEVTAANEADQPLLDELLEDDFPSELERAAGLCVSEGEIWARVYTDPLVAPRPLLEWVSRKDVLPYWVGKRLAGAAYITELEHPRDNKKCLRLLEVHVAGTVLNALYEGSDDKIGERVTRDRWGDSPDLAELEEVWEHGLATMLLFRIPNRLRRNPRIGVSDFDTIRDNLLDLNEAAAIGAHNMRLTARKRAVISQAAARGTTFRNDLDLTPEESPGGTVPRARFDAAEEVFVEDPLDAELGKEPKDPFRIIEYSFDAAALIAWKLDLVETALTRTGLSAQFVGVTAGNEGYAISGTSLRLRLIPTTSTGRGKDRYWKTGLPRIITALQQIDALPTEAGGFGRSWNAAAKAPTIERQAGLPTDEQEEAARHAALVNAGIESKRQAIRELHPDWTEAQVQDELDELENQAPPAGAMFGLPTGA